MAILDLKTPTEGEEEYPDLNKEPAQEEKEGPLQDLLGAGAGGGPDALPHLFHQAAGQGVDVHGGATSTGHQFGLHLHETGHNCCHEFEEQESLQTDDDDIPMDDDQDSLDDVVEEFGVYSNVDIAFPEEELSDSEGGEDQQTNDEEENEQAHDDDQEYNDEAPHRKKDITDKQRREIFEDLLRSSNNGTLKRNSTTIIAAKYNVHIRTVQRVWKRAKKCWAQGLPADVNGLKSKHCGRKKIQVDLSAVANIPLNRRGTIRSLANALGVNKSTLHRRFKEGMLRRHSDSLKPYLKEADKKDRLRWCLTMLDRSSLPNNPKFVEMKNIIHTDEKWFNGTRKTRTMYMHPNEDRWWWKTEVMDDKLLAAVGTKTVCSGVLYPIRKKRLAQNFDAALYWKHSGRPAHPQYTPESRSSAITAWSPAQILPAPHCPPGVTPPPRRRPAPHLSLTLPLTRSSPADLAPVHHARYPSAGVSSVGRHGAVRQAISAVGVGPSRQTGWRRKVPAGAGSIARPAGRSSNALIRARRLPASRKTAATPSSPIDTATAVKSPPLVMLEQGGILCKRRRGGSSVQVASSQDSATAHSIRCPAQLRMDPTQSKDGKGSQEQFPGAYQPAWNPYMYGYPPRAAWFPQGFQPGPPNVPMMNPSGYAPEGFERPEPYDQHSETDLEEVPAPTAKTRNKKSVTRTKLSNFNPEEDRNLVKSYLEISCDPIISTAQKNHRMWERIIERYNLRRASNHPVRTSRSLQSRWDAIRSEVNLFASFYAASIRENPSGMSDADKTSNAVSNFAGVKQRKFAFLHCWDLMKDSPKWQDPNATDIATAAQGEGFGDDRNAGADNVDQSGCVRSGGQARRPIGRDSAKAAKKKANSDAGSTSSTEYASRMQDLSLKRNSLIQEENVRKNDRFQLVYEDQRKHNESLIQIEKEKLQFMREQHEYEKRKEEKKEDERILSINLDACTPSLRVYYENCQQEILERQAERRRRNQAP